MSISTIMQVLWLMVDLGISFPDEATPGIDVVLRFKIYC